MTDIKQSIVPSASENEIRKEIRQIHEAAKEVKASPDLARQFLAATGMYTPNGKINPQFR